MEKDYDFKFAYKQHFCLSSSGSELENEEEFQRLYGNFEPLPVPIDPDKVIVIHPDESLNGQNQNQVGTSTNELSLENTKSKRKRNRRKKTAAVEMPVMKNVQSKKNSQGSINSLPTNRVTSSCNEVLARQVHQTIVDMHSSALDKCLFDQAFPSIRSSNFYSALSLDKMATVVENSQAHSNDLDLFCRKLDFVSSRSTTVQKASSEQISSPIESVSQKGRRSRKKKKKTQINSQAESNKQVPKPEKPTFKFNEDDFPALRARNIATCTIEYKKMDTSETNESKDKENNNSQVHTPNNETEMANHIVNFIKEEMITPYLNLTLTRESNSVSKGISNSVSNGISIYETMRSPVSEDINVKQSDIIDNMLQDTSFDFLNNYYGFYNDSESEKVLASYQVTQVNEDIVEINESKNIAKTTENIMRKPKREMNVINTIIQNDDTSRNSLLCDKHCCTQIRGNSLIVVGTRTIGVNTDDQMLSTETHSIGIDTSDGEVIIGNVGVDTVQKGIIETFVPVSNMTIGVLNKVVKLAICDDELYPSIKLGIQLMIIYLMIKMFLSVVMCAVDNMVIIWLIFLFRLLFR